MNTGYVYGQSGIFSAISRRIWRFSRCRQGTAALEFVLVLPVILIFFFATVDASLWVVDDASLLNGTRVAVRQVRIRALVNANDKAAFVKAVCDNAGRTGDDCAAVVVNLQQFSGFSNVTWPTDAAKYTYQSTTAQSVVAVTVEAPHVFTIPGIAGLFGGNITQAPIIQHALMLTEP